ncbi:Ig-like domain-containing protein [Roseateles chitinivorans]|uniref:Ig-like domain-containing protein n=1 Tax=Roseateles chitinivorans TaxID=2917965 RepID=UPI003D672264
MTIFAKFARLVRTATLGAFVAGTLAACGGGGGNAGTPVNGGGSGGGGATPTAVADLSVVLDRSTVSNSGADTVKVTVTAVDANRQVVGNVPLVFAVDSNAVIAPGGTKTDATSGQLAATVAIGSDKTNRTVTIAVATGSITKKVTFDVVDSVTGGKVADLSLVFDTASIPNDGSQTAKLTVTSLDANRTAVGGSPVVFSVQDPANTAFVSAAGTTDATSGQVVATVAVGSNHTNRTVTVTATSGTVVRTVGLNIVPPITTQPTANDMTMVLDKISIGNTGSDKVTATVTAVDSQRNVIPGIPIAFTADNGSTVAVVNGTTNAQGQAVATITSGADKSNRLITVTARSDALTRTATFQVTGVKVTASAVPTQPAAGSAGNRVEFRVSDVNQNPMTFQAITVSAPGLPTATGTTDANGAYTYTYTAPAVSGAIDITGTAGGVSTAVTVTVPSSSSTVPPATPVVVSASVQASPTVVSVNTDSTNNRAEVRAIFLAASNSPVKNVRVRFDLNGDANSIGGTINSGQQLVYSDANGIATTSYAPGNRASPTGGVQIRACWDYNDFAATACPNSVVTTLTVVSDPLSITIGTNELVDVSNPLTYIKRYVVLVVDAAGQPKGDVQITPSLDLNGYYKGYYELLGDLWGRRFDLDTLGNKVVGGAPVCRNEDDNRNGAIDGIEDRNGNGQLDPRKSDASISMTGSTRTDANGQAVLVLQYPRSVASWVNFTITASAFGVLSPPATYTGDLPFAGDVLGVKTSAPAFQTSPYGVVRKASDATYCTNKD